MKKIDLNTSGIICVSGILLLLIYFCNASSVRTDNPLKCHICDPDTCKNWTEKNVPQECTIDHLNADNIGPSKLAHFSHIQFSSFHVEVPEFACLKVEAYDNKEKYTLRKCQPKLSGNESCANFYKRLNADSEKTYTNATCYVCDDRNGCNSSGLIYIWTPILVSSLILCILIK